MKPDDELEQQHTRVTRMLTAALPIAARYMLNVLMDADKPDAMRMRAGETLARMASEHLEREVIARRVRELRAELGINQRGELAGMTADEQTEALIRKYLPGVVAQREQEPR